ncbi:SRPBCC family protein [Aeromicrobium sp.]|uniref:SRPBCC family protein n=1 Tax=Aeromicrobium sp. TaxID=1871063 RepID=UPI0019C6BD75|nr:SRPBCC family protein [Aeromicrobium sp.]MBC7632893.1 SRPBCC family protein [Aeromicrobium sp.]
MPRIARRMFVAAPADQVWSLIQDFDRWHPRLNIYAGGPETDPDLVVTVVERDDETMSLSYRMPEPPFPITDHLAVISVTEYRESTCHVEWSASFESDPGIMHQLEDELGDDIFSLALDRLATAAHEQRAADVAAEGSSTTA